jgi:hypothetical protein
VGLASHEAIKRPSKGAQKPWFLGSFWLWEGVGDGFLRPKVSKLKKSKINRLINMLQFYHHLKTIVLSSKCGQNP